MGMGIGRTPPKTPGQPPPSRLEDLLAANTQAMTNLERAIRETAKRPPSDVRLIGVTVPEKSPYEEENITDGTMTINKATIQATPKVADCRWWKYLTAVISFTGASGAVSCFVQLKGSTSPTPTEGTDISVPQEVLIGEKLICNIEEGDWSPYIYATLYNPLGASFTGQIRIDIIRRGLI